MNGTEGLSLTSVLELPLFQDEPTRVCQYNATEVDCE